MVTLERTKAGTPVVERTEDVIMADIWHEWKALESDEVHGGGEYFRSEVAAKSRPHLERIRELCKELGREVDDYDASEWWTVLSQKQREILGVQLIM